MTLIIKKDQPLKKLTSFRIGGPADYFAEVASKQELSEALAWARSKNLAIFILGGGTNVLISDKGFRGLVIKISNRLLDFKENAVSVGAGLPLIKLVTSAVKAGFTGLEWAVGIPGSVGGAIRGNAGAYGGEIKDNLASVSVCDLDSGVWRIFSAQECGFAYRDSIFKKQRNWLIWQADFAVASDPLGQAGILIENILAKRSELPSEPSAGCVFKNPCLDGLPLPAKAIIDNFAERIKGDKLPCGILTEALALKGLTIGGAKLSEKHGNFIVNQNGASANDVLALATEIHDMVSKHFAIDLEKEIELIGF